MYKQPVNSYNFQTFHQLYSIQEALRGPPPSGCHSPEIVLKQLPGGMWCGYKLLPISQMRFSSTESKQFGTLLKTDC